MFGKFPALVFQHRVACYLEGYICNIRELRRLIGKPKEKRPHGIFVGRLEDKTKMI
jgi:hypothetical protein